MQIRVIYLDFLWILNAEPQVDLMWIYLCVILVDSICVSIIFRLMFEALVNIKQIPNICAFWPHFEPHLCCNSRCLPPFICEYAHLICSTCPDRLRQGYDYGCVQLQLPLRPVTCHDACTTCTRNQTCPPSARHVQHSLWVMWGLQLKTVATVDNDAARSRSTPHSCRLAAYLHTTLWRIVLASQRDRWKHMLCQMLLLLPPFHSLLTWALIKSKFKHTCTPTTGHNPKGQTYKFAKSLSSQTAAGAYELHRLW